jgi:ribonuclease-3
MLGVESELFESNKLEKLQEISGVSFKDSSLLQQALVHGSYLHENPDFNLPSNERLEFLGDSLLSFVMADKLYRDCPDLTEGGMTKLRAELVRKETLARLASSLGLGNYLYMGHGEEASGGRGKQSILASTLESLIGAILLDQGFDTCRAFVLRLFDDELGKSIDERLSADYKSKLQETVQSRHRVAPTYHTIKATGPDHAKEFTVEVSVNGKVIGVGRGRSKRQAEREAARKALESLEQD